MEPTTMTQQPMNKQTVRNSVITMEKQIVKARAKEFIVDDSDHPFKDDKLGRQPYAEILTGVVETLTDGAVIALNGAWGTGKTTFLKMWSHHLKNEKFQVVYYNAWEDDISDEPLLSMVRGMKSLQEGEKLDKLFRVVAKVLVGALSGAFSAATGMWGKVAKGAVKGGMKQFEESFYEALKQDDDRTILIQSFKESLMDYMTTVCAEGKPLVFMVDELDRCNPDFAVKVLERIKHLFDVPNIVFVLSIDKKQLACSVKGFYGSNEIDADEYLRRFIDYDYYLPEPNAEQFCEFLYEYFDFNAFLRNAYRLNPDYFGKNSNKADEERNDFLAMAKALINRNHLNLRQVERIFSTARIGLCSMPLKSEISPELFLFLSYLKVCKPMVFEKIDSFVYGLQDFVDVMGELIVPEDLSPNTEERDWFNYLLGLALSSYYGSYRIFVSNTRREVVKLYDQGKLMVDLKAFDQTIVDNILKNCKVNNISFIIRRLNLVEKLTELPQANVEVKNA